MQYININKTLEFDKKIEDLLLISIDDQLDSIDDKDGVRINGKITIGGNVKTIEDNKDFEEYIDIDIFLTYEEIIERNSLKVTVNDFNYKIEDSKLYLDISLKIEGLKEIEATFLAKEDNGFSNEEKMKFEEKKVYIGQEIIINDKIEEDNYNQKVVVEKINLEENTRNNEDNKEDYYQSDLKENIENLAFEDDQIDFIEQRNEVIDVKEYTIENNKNDKKSLLKSVFSNKRIKEEVSWRLHCVKNEKSYEEIAYKYNVNIDKLKSINNNEELLEGKLIFLPIE